MEGTEEKVAFVQTTPPHEGGLNHPARPGLFFIDFWKREFIISQEMIEYNGPDLRSGEIAWVIRWKKP